MFDLQTGIWKRYDAPCYCGGVYRAVEGLYGPQPVCDRCGGTITNSGKCIPANSGYYIPEPAREGETVMDAELRRLTGKRDEYNEKQDWDKADRIQAQIDRYAPKPPEPDPRVQPGPDERHAKPQ